MTPAGEHDSLVATGSYESVADALLRSWRLALVVLALATATLCIVAGQRRSDSVATASVLVQDPRAFVGATASQTGKTYLADQAAALELPVVTQPVATELTQRDPGRPISAAVVAARTAVSLPSSGSPQLTIAFHDPDPKRAADAVDLLVERLTALRAGALTGLTATYIRQIDAGLASIYRIPKTSANRRALGTTQQELDAQRAQLLAGVQSRTAGTDFLVPTHVEWGGRYALDLRSIGFAGLSGALLTALLCLLRPDSRLVLAGPLSADGHHLGVLAAPLLAVVPTDAIRGAPDRRRQAGAPRTRRGTAPSAAPEHFRFVAQAFADRTGVLCFTAAQHRDGVSTVVLQTGRALAQSSRRVLIVHVAGGAHEGRSAVGPQLEQASLSVDGAPQGLSARLAELAAGVDIVLVDCPPVLEFARVGALLAVADGVLVVTSPRTTREHVYDMQHRLMQCGARVLGQVHVEMAARRAVPWPRVGTFRTTAGSSRG